MKETSWSRNHTHSWEKRVNGDLSSVLGGANGSATDSICEIREGFPEEVALYLGLKDEQQMRRVSERKALRERVETVSWVIYK